VIEPEQRTVIRDYVVKERVAPVRVKARTAVGAPLPADVELRTAPHLRTKAIEISIHLFG
jgi:hypothetical protein